MKSKSNVKRRREVPFLNYDVDDFQDYETISEYTETKQIVFNTLVEAVSHSISYKKKKADMFMLNGSQCVELEKDKWRESLERAIDFYSSEDIEDYESCKKCKELIDKI